MSDRILRFLQDHGDDRNSGVMAFHKHWLPTMRIAKGSSGNHQFWEGGYYDHILDCFLIAHRMWMALSHRDMPFTFSSVLYVLYFHDVEKMWKYGMGEGILNLADEEGKEQFYMTELPQDWDVWLTDDELNALKYIHGEGDDYSKYKRVMGPLGGFCHAVDVLSARTFPDRRPDKLKVIYENRNP